MADNMTVFGTGLLSLVPAGGGDPITVGILQDISFENSQATKGLYGEMAYAVDLGKGEAKVSGKIKTGALNFTLISAIVGGAAITTGSVVGVAGEAATIDQAAFTYTCATVTGIVDLGVFDATAQIWLAPVATTPTTGQYEMAAGVYTFASADKAHTMKLYYTHTSATGKTLKVSNFQMGDDTAFQLEMFNKRRKDRFGLRVYNAILTKYSLGFKNNDFAISDIDYEAFAGADGVVYDMFRDTVA